MKLLNIVCAQSYMPLPPADVAEDSENTENGTGDEKTPALQFSYVECLLYVLHQLGRRHPKFLSATENETVKERMKDFKIR